MEDTNTEHIEITPNFIDIDKVIAGKSPSLQKKLPRFLVGRLKKLLHVDEINFYVYKFRDKFGPDFTNAVLTEALSVNIEVVNPENIPQGVNPLMVGNHPLGGVDGMALINEVGKVRRDILFPVNDFLLYLPGLRNNFIPINKVGRNNKNINALETAFKENNALLYFPAGLCSRKHKGVIKDLEWKKTFIKKAVQYHRDITPIYVDAKNTNRFYRIANWRKKLGIKFNIEMILLPDEMFKQRNKTIRLVFGKPIPYTTFDSSKTDSEWAALVREHVYNLDKNPNLEFKK
ncbi:MAG: 1-acyl-sn-glycerol-3-phosphate acyltransferase [Bacteroidales bacterium]|nr:1-acyl-sn-glycerol-3-phosphate acyltransferase [Bacteroidales bacterium]